ncbi:uncharacterized protein LOC128224595 [Mya arenaria]|uniref:uncharacterized protein LOC128224595 n=1 Tax=Mya arenaria TaxID=6604 RepID=UPI0022E027CC|nr:uncharacterized protein LOC128224595 [Mya arenaria]
MPSPPEYFAEAREEFGKLQPESELDIKNAESIGKAFQSLEETLPAQTSEQGTCYHCSEETKVINTSMLKRGQHITVPGEKTLEITNKIRTVIPNFPFLYKHHAIIAKVNDENRYKVRLEIIQVDKSDTHHVTKDEVYYDLRYDDIWIVNYLRVQRSSEEVAQAAEKAFDDGVPCRYQLFTRNCEHFATSCVLGREHSLQVEEIFNTAERFANNLQVPGGRLVAKIVAKVISEFLDEIALGVTASKYIAGIVLGMTSVATLLYSVAMTMYYRKLYENSDMCPCCFRRKVTEVWLCFAVFASTSAVTFCMLNLAVPLATVVTSGFTVVVILLSLYTQWKMPKILQAISSPFKIIGKQVEGLADINPGDVVSFKYWLFEHFGIVTDKTSSGVKIVHYSTSQPFATRIIVEEEFSLSNNPMLKYDCSHLDTFSLEETVIRVRMRINETKWGPVVNRSDHLCYWAKVRQYQPIDENAHSNLPADLMIGTTQIHLDEDIQIGDHAFLADTDGIVWQKDYSIEPRKFRVWLVCLETGICKVLPIKVNLEADWVTVQEYHPARCRPKKERAGAAMRLLNESHQKQTFLEMII